MKYYSSQKIQEDYAQDRMAQLFEEETAHGEQFDCDDVHELLNC